jgi:hypothetical protein
MCFSVDYRWTPADRTLKISEWCGNNYSNNNEPYDLVQSDYAHIHGSASNEGSSRQHVVGSSAKPEYSRKHSRSGNYDSNNHHDTDLHKDMYCSDATGSSCSSPAVSEEQCDAHIFTSSIE